MKEIFKYLILFFGLKVFIIYSLVLMYHVSLKKSYFSRLFKLYRIQPLLIIFTYNSLDNIYNDFSFENFIKENQTV